MKLMMTAIGDLNHYESNRCGERIFRGWCDRRPKNVFECLSGWIMPGSCQPPLDCWVYENYGELRFTRYGKPMGDACVESLNGHERGKCLNWRVFARLANAHQVIEAWGQKCNRERLHHAIEGIILEIFRKQFESETIARSEVITSTLNEVRSRSYWAF